MQLIIISGAPASGKTALGQKLAAKLGYEFYSKDVIKEALFDARPKTTHKYLWYEEQANARFLKAITDSISRNASIIIDSDFVRTSDRRQLLACLSKNVSVAEIHCHAKGLTRLRRYIKRNEAGARHKGHHDRRWYPSMFMNMLLSYAGVAWPYQSLDISGKKLLVDTTDFSKINYQDIVAFVTQ
jgi:predicted kinase